MHITQSRYFLSGAYWKGHQYALYDVIADRIVMCFYNKHVLHTLQVILSSRYNLLLCDLTTAPNWEDNLIDNSCCYAWRVTGDDFKIGGQLGKHLLADVYSISNLENVQPINEQELIFQDQELFLFAAIIIEYLLDNAESAE